MFDVIVRTYYCSFLGKKKKSQNNKERILSRNKNVYPKIRKQSQWQSQLQ